MKRLLLITALVLTGGFRSFGQITIQNTMTPQQLVENILVGQGIVVSNITYNGSAASATTIQGNTHSFITPAGSPFPFPGGVRLKTDGGTGTLFVNNDPDLNAIATNSVENGVVLEFDFIPSGDTLFFNYMFASEEYPDYVCSDYNDVFGFFISGPGFSGPYQNGAENIALIPGTSVPVSINTVNPGTSGIWGEDSYCASQDPNWENNDVYYTTAYQSTAGYPYNGGTVPLGAAASLQCGVTYHIKLAIANVGDQALNSGVYLQSNSFQSEAVEVSVATVTGDTTVVEGCTSASFIFVRSESMIGDTLTVSYTVGGDAVQGTDYNNLPSPLAFLPGQDTIVVTLSPVDDGIVENTETVTITATTITPCGDTIISTGTIYIIDTPFLTVSATDPTTTCMNDSVVSTIISTDGGLEPYTYVWSEGGQTGTTGYLPISVPGTLDYYVTVTDACGFTQEDTITVTYDPTLQIDSLHMTPSSICVPTGSVAGFFSGNVGPVTLHWTGPGNPGTFNSSTTSLNNIPAGEYFFTVTNLGCVVIDTITVTNTAPPVIAITESDITIGCPTDSALVTALGVNGTAPYTYAWSFAGQTGPTAYVPNMVQGSSVDYYVTATDACGFTAIDTVTVTLNQVLAIDTLYSYPASACNADGTVQAIVMGVTGTGIFHWEGPDPTFDHESNLVSMSDIPSGWYYFSVTDDVCSVSDSVFVEQSNPPIAAFTASVLNGCDPLDVTFTNNSQNSTNFAWDFGNGQTANTGIASSVGTTYTLFGGTVQLIAFQGNCSDTATLTIEIATCGCMDPIALNYNPLATVNDNSCDYALPTCVVPNVFTPDNTGVNDFYQLITTNALNIDMTITNRWGNVLFKQSGLSPKWDGKSQNGNLADDGVYYVTYTIIGLTQTIEGHGFFHLVR